VQGAWGQGKHGREDGGGGGGDGCREGRGGGGGEKLKGRDGEEKRAGEGSGGRGGGAGNSVKRQIRLRRLGMRCCAGFVAGVAHVADIVLGLSSKDSLAAYFSNTPRDPVWTMHVAFTSCGCVLGCITVLLHALCEETPTNSVFPWQRRYACKVCHIVCGTLWLMVAVGLLLLEAFWNDRKEEGGRRKEEEREVLRVCVLISRFLLLGEAAVTVIECAGCLCTTAVPDGSAFEKADIEICETSLGKVSPQTTSPLSSVEVQVSNVMLSVETNILSHSAMPPQSLWQPSTSTSLVPNSRRSADTRTSPLRNGVFPDSTSLSDLSSRETRLSQDPFTFTDHSNIGSTFKAGKGEAGGGLGGLNPLGSAPSSMFSPPYEDLESLCQNRPASPSPLLHPQRPAAGVSWDLYPNAGIAGGTFGANGTGRSGVDVSRKKSSDMELHEALSAFDQVECVLYRYNVFFRLFCLSEVLALL
jgi:hypothetical protein